MLREMNARADVVLSHVDTAVRWRSTNDTGLHIRVIGGLWQALRDSIKVYRAIRVSRPDVIHICTSASLATAKDILILFMARVLGVRRVTHYHFGRLPTIINTRGWEWQLSRRAIALSDTILVLDKSSEDSVRQALPSVSVQRIPNPIGIDMIRKAVPRAESKKLASCLPSIIYAGWVVPTKGVRELVEACCAIEGIPFELNIVGNVLDDFRLELETIAAQREKGKWLKFHGQLEWEGAIAATFKADVFVLPSYTEGFPNVILEAMALGKPIVATSVGAIPEMLGDGTTEPCGVLVSPCNVEELRAAILFVLTHPEEAIVYGERAKRKALKLYSMDRVLDQYAGLWRSLKELKS